MNKLFFIFGLFLFSHQLVAEELDANRASFGIGISAGAVSGTGIDVIKYMGDYYIQGSGMFIYEAQGDSFTDFALVFGKYLHKEKVLSFGMPVGFKMFGGVNYTYDDAFQKAFGFGVEFFNPGSRGVGVWYNVSYGTPKVIDSFQFYNAVGLVYNF